MRLWIISELKIFNKSDSLEMYYAVTVGSTDCRVVTLTHDIKSRVV